MPAPRRETPQPFQSPSQRPQDEYRTEPRRRQSTSFASPTAPPFTPAQRVSSQPPRGRVFNEGQPQPEQEVEIINQPPPRFSNMPQGEGQGPLTKSGYPDRRFRGQRDLPPPEESNPEFQRARTGGTIGNMHVTIEGKPDRRFKENRAMSEEELMARWADEVQARFGRNR